MNENDCKIKKRKTYTIYFRKGLINVNAGTTEYDIADIATEESSDCSRAYAGT